MKILLKELYIEERGCYGEVLYFIKFQRNEEVPPVTITIFSEEECDPFLIWMIQNTREILTTDNSLAPGEILEFEEGECYNLNYELPTKAIKALNEHLYQTKHKASALIRSVKKVAQILHTDLPEFDYYPTQNETKIV